MQYIASTLDESHTLRLFIKHDNETIHRPTDLCERTTAAGALVFYSIFGTTTLLDDLVSTVGDMPRSCAFIDLLNSPNLFDIALLELRPRQRCDRCRVDLRGL